MSEIINVAGVHKNGEAELQVGIRNNQFVMKRDPQDNRKVQFTDLASGSDLIPNVPTVTESANGLMDSDDKVKLNSIEYGANKVQISVDKSQNLLIFTL